jgi:hypothetical protein
MGSGEDSEGLRHKPRHNARDAEKAPVGMGWFELKLIGWGVPPENPDVDAIRVRLGKVWRRLSFPDQSRLLNAAEVIAEAEAVKAAWNPKADAARHRQLRNLANDASKLARKFGLMFPPPWVGKDRDLLVRLVGLAQNTLVATMPVEKQGYACGTAQILRGVTRRLVARTGYAHFQLLADLAWLASGMRQEISEHAVRRYLEVPLHPVFSRKSAPRKVKKR